MDAGKNINEKAGGDINQSASGDIRESANNKTEILEDKHIRSSLESTQYAEGLTVVSTKENMLLESGKTVKMNSAEKTNLF